MERWKDGRIDRLFDRCKEGRRKRKDGLTGRLICTIS
jgi:hypothetical protein